MLAACELSRKRYIIENYYLAPAATVNRRRDCNVMAFSRRIKTFAIETTQERIIPSIRSATACKIHSKHAKWKQRKTLFDESRVTFLQLLMRNLNWWSVTISFHCWQTIVANERQRYILCFRLGRSFGVLIIKALENKTLWAHTQFMPCGALINFSLLQNDFSTCTRNFAWFSLHFSTLN